MKAKGLPLVPTVVIAEPVQMRYSLVVTAVVAFRPAPDWSSMIEILPMAEPQNVAIAAVWRRHRCQAAAGRVAPLLGEDLNHLPQDARLGPR